MTVISIVVIISDRSDFQKEDETYRLLLKLTVERSDSQVRNSSLFTF